jgi:hypothetical protein
MEKARLAIAQSMKQAGLSIEQVAELTGLSKAVVKDL